MSAVIPKADIDWSLSHVRFVPKADISRAIDHFIGAGDQTGGTYTGYAVRTVLSIIASRGLTTPACS